MVKNNPSSAKYHLSRANLRWSKIFNIRSTLAKALKRISTQKIFMTLSEDEVPLNINSYENPGVISVVNNPKFDTSYSPVIATIIHTIVKQMSVRKSMTSFLLMEDAYHTTAQYAPYSCNFKKL